MSIRRRLLSIHPAWGQVVALFFFLTVEWGIVFNSAGLFIAPIQASLGVTRSAMLLGGTLKGIGSLLGSILGTYVFSHFRILKVMKVAGLSLFASYGALYFIQNVYQYQFLLFLQSFSAGFCGFMAISILINNWFQSRTGTAMGLAFMGSGLGGILFNSLGAYWIGLYGWRVCILLFAFIFLAAQLIIIWFVLKEHPSLLDLEAYGHRKMEDLDAETLRMLYQGDHLEEVIRRPSFWLIQVGMMLMCLSSNSLMGNISPHLSDLGYSLQVGANVSSMAMLVLMVGKFGAGYLFDKFGLKLGSLISAASLLLGAVGMILARFPLAFVAIGLGLGLGSAYSSIALPLYSQTLYGRLDYARISAFMQTINGLNGIVGPIFLAALYRRSGGYQMAWWTIALTLALCIVLWFRILPSRRTKSEPATQI